LQSQHGQNFKENPSWVPALCGVPGPTQHGHKFDSEILSDRCFHNWMHTSKQSVKVPLQDELIVFVHVPRTSGETLKIALFNDVDYQYNPQWTDFVTEYPMIQRAGKILIS
jgi:hypothetical protein